MTERISVSWMDRYRDEENRERRALIEFMDGELMKTDSSLCAGCNKCIFKCPTHANDAVLEDGENKIHVNNELCIWCGECLDVCDHNARELNDDTQKFFQALKDGEPISVIAAPALQHNIPEYKRLFGYLRSLGVNLIYDVSFGADITVWGYLKAIRENNIKTMISQPCPVIVRYIEHFRPELLPYLAPVQSPALCTGIYMKKYEGCKDKLAFLSPCISKTVEFTDENTGGYVTYNVTYKRLLHYLEENYIDLAAYDEVSFDNKKGSLGGVFSRPGGLKENVQFYLGDVWVKQVEGIEEVNIYFDEYMSRIQKGAPVPLLVDALNCRNGCNKGTATIKDAQLDDIDLRMAKIESEVQHAEAEKLFQYFDETLTLEDFSRVYVDASQLHEKVTEEQIEQVFNKLEKFTEKDKTVNCFSCGYGNCRNFANAVALGQNHVENCFQYTKAMLKKQTEEVAQKHKTIISSLNYASKIQRNLLPNEENLAEAFPEHQVLWFPKDIVGGDIYWLKTFKDGALLCICDCTGHGTPGALLTMLVVSALDAVVKDSNYKDTAYILWALDQRMKKALNVVEAERTEGWQSVTDINDGADLALMFVNDNGEVIVSAGNTHVFVCDGKEVQDIKGQKLRVGCGEIRNREDVRTVVIPPNPDNKYYAASDGLFDQIGGQTNKPFGYKPFKSIILENHDKSLPEIFDKVWHEFENHRGEECRRDDVALVGFRP